MLVYLWYCTQTDWHEKADYGRVREQKTVQREEPRPVLLPDRALQTDQETIGRDVHATERLPGSPKFPSGERSVIYARAVGAPCSHCTIEGRRCALCFVPTGIRSWMNSQTLLFSTG